MKISKGILKEISERDSHGFDNEISIKNPQENINKFLKNISVNMR